MPRNKGNTSITRPTSYCGLWWAVIEQALSDVTTDTMTGVGESERDSVRKQTLKYLLNRSKDFDLVCDLAGVNPESGHKHVMKVLRQGGVV